MNKIAVWKRYFQKNTDFFTVCRLLIFSCFIYRFFIFLFKICPQYIDLDQTLMWYGTVCFAHFYIPEPHFFGQAYGLMLESFAAVPLYLLHIPLSKALPAVTMLLTFFPFLYLSERSKKDHPVLSLLLLALPFYCSYGVDLLMSVPRSLFAGYAFSVPGAVLLSDGKSEKKVMWGVILLYLGIMAVSPTLIMYSAALFFAWKSGVFAKEKLKFFIYGNLIGGSIALFSRLFYIFFPDYVVHRVPFLPVGWIYFKDNIIQFREFCSSLLPLPSGNHIYIIFLVITVITLILLKQKNYILLLLLSFLYFGTIPVLFFISRTCEYSEKSFLFGSHRYYLYLLPATALFLYLAKKKIFLEKKHSYFITSLITLLAVALTLYKLNTFPQNHHEQLGNMIYAIEKLEQLEKYMDSTEEMYNKIKPNAVIVQSSAFAYAFAARMYGTVDVFIPNFDKKTWDYRKIYETNGTRHFLIRFFDDSPQPYLLLKLDHGKSLKEFFDTNFHSFVLDERINGIKIKLLQTHQKKYGVRKIFQRKLKGTKTP